MAATVPCVTSSHTEKFHEPDSQAGRECLAAASRSGSAPGARMASVAPPLAATTNAGDATDARLLRGLKALRFPDDFGQALAFSEDLNYVSSRIRKNGDTYVIREELTFEDAHTAGEEISQLAEETGVEIADLSQNDGHGVNGHSVYDVVLPSWDDAARFLSVVLDEPELASLPKPSLA